MKKQYPFPQPADLRPLVDRAKTGDQAAFSELYERTSTDLYRVIHAMVRDEDMTWDILQNTYIRVYRSLPTLRDSNSFWPWLRQIAVNETAAQTAQRLPLTFTDVAGAEEQAFEIPDVRPESQPELAFDRKETAQLVQDILDELSDGQRLLVGMYYFQQLPIREIAETLQVSPGTVKTQLSRSRKKIEDAVKRLETQGVKLYGLSPLPFLLALLRQQEPAAEAGKAALAKAIEKAGLAAGTRAVEKAGLAAGAKAAAPLAEAVAVHVGRPFFETVLGRTILGVIVAAIIGGGILGYNWIKNHSYGDVLPPKFVDTDEDLTTEPTDTLPTQPDTTEELTTAPPTTGPEDSTEPTTTTAPSQPVEPGAPETSSQPPEPSASGEQPTEPQTGATVRWDDASSGLDWHAQAGPKGYTSRTLCISCPYADSIRVYTDNTDILTVKQNGPASHSIVSDTLYVDSKWSVTPLAEGTARVFVEINDALVQTLTVSVQTPPSIFDMSFNSYSYDGYGEEALKNCAVGSEFQFYVSSLGQELPVVSSSNPSVARVEMKELQTNFTGPVFEHSVTIIIVGAGDATITLAQAGTAYKSWAVHASAYDYDRTDSGEDLIPFDAPPQIMSWHINGSRRPLILYAGKTEALYVKVKGAEPPTIVSDDPSVISVGAASYEWYEDRNVTEFWYPLTANRSGICSVTCYYNGAKIFAVQFLVP